MFGAKAPALKAPAQGPSEAPPAPAWWTTRFNQQGNISTSGLDCCPNKMVKMVGSLAHNADCYHSKAAIQRRAEAKQRERDV